MAIISIPPDGLEGAAEIYRENILDRSLLKKVCSEKEAPRTFGARMAFHGGAL